MCGDGTEYIRKSANDKQEKKPILPPKPIKDMIEERRKNNNRT